MSYARAIDVGVYAKRKYAPIEDRVRSIIVVENQAPNIMIAAKTNLAEVLPKPYVELAIQTARGASEFLKKDLIEGLADLKDETLRATFLQSNRRAATALTEYAAWLEKEKLPKATPEFAIGEEKYHRFLAETELVDMPPAKLLELGLAELKKEQDVFAEAAKKIDETRPADVVFKQIQSDHPTAANLIPEVTKRLDAVKKFVADRKLVTLSSEAKVQVKETPQDRRATSFASMDTPGPFEKRANESYFYVTPPENDWNELQKEEWLTSFNYYMGDLFSIHEVYPGHYVQFLHLNASKATKTEKIFGATSFVEGWAHYCEKMIVDEGFGGAAPGAKPSEDEVQRTAKYRMVQAQAAMVRLCRLCVSIKMHTQGMSVDEATKFFPGELLLRRKTGAHRSDARHVRSRLSQLHTRQIADPKTARRLQSAGRRKFLAPEIPQRTAQPRHATHPSPPRDHAQGQSEMGQSAVTARESPGLLEAAQRPVRHAAHNQLRKL